MKLAVLIAVVYTSIVLAAGACLVVLLGRAIDQQYDRAGQWVVKVP